MNKLCPPEREDFECMQAYLEKRNLSSPNRSKTYDLPMDGCLDLGITSLDTQGRIKWGSGKCQDGPKKI